MVRHFSNEKRTSFMDYLDLPAHVASPLELALCMLQTDEEQRDREMLQSKGWGVQDPWQICATPSDYRGYVQRSRGEFSCCQTFLHAALQRLDQRSNAVFPCQRQAGHYTTHRRQVVSFRTTKGSFASGTSKRRFGPWNKRKRTTCGIVGWHDR